MEEPLRLLYTGGIRGDLALLPRLYTFLRQLGGARQSGVLLLDIGGASGDTWHCRATGGRSTLHVLDAMGCHAANVDGALDEENRAKLAKQVALGLVDAERDWRAEAADVVATSRPRASGHGLRIALAPAPSTSLDGATLQLERVYAGQVGEVVVDLQDRPRLVSARIHRMPPRTAPNPSIAGTVDFVLGEARLFQAERARQAI